MVNDGFLKLSYLDIAGWLLVDHDAWFLTGTSVCISLIYWGNS